MVTCYAAKSNFRKMKKTFLILILITINLMVFSQRKIIIDQPFTYLSFYRTQTVEIDSLNQLPSKIQYIANTILDSAMTGFLNNIRFVKGQIIDLDLLLNDDSVSQTENNFIVPKYQLFFEWADSSLNIKKYCFELSFDQYGQVTFFEWPREDYNKKENFINPQSVLTKAVKYAKNKEYKTDTFLSEFKYDSELNRMCWYISFLQSSTGDKFNYTKNYNVVVIDATALLVLKEMGMGSVGID